ncbi:MAG: RNA polymerase sigma-70 factor [Bacteroidetes bacterium]|nr:RNA polymerase sigma-70 factor [Bacteroidota bacterium]MBT3750733.1 RNA polymerase sigma-70 factor [Bacteroidota bacterium]MBT4399713.1 RNA polymerase sigma-70 factor [Bacteroidota bacterium]MBT4412054.1 RNA polymerase sigma-70 factor [Bacteroidota bacterium]MBT7091920.1 RNA polymerase sigma-70 factor [Bacteroidota bacterium]
METTLHISAQAVLGSKSEFESLFRDHYSKLCAYANVFLNDLDAAEDIVQEVLFKLWKGRENLVIKSSVKSYLFRAVRNACLNLISHISIREDYKSFNEQEIQQTEQKFVDDSIVSELENKIRESIDLLPIERRKVFVMSRYDGLKYREIADKLGISVKTVENQMYKALQFMRKNLSDYMPLILLIFRGLFNDFKDFLN